MKPLHVVLAVLITAIWGVNFSVIKLGLATVDPFILAGIRFSLCALPAIFFIRKPDVPWRYIIGYGLMFGIGLWGGGQSWDQGRAFGRNRFSGSAVQCLFHHFAGRMGVQGIADSLSGTGHVDSSARASVHHHDQRWFGHLDGCASGACWCCLMEHRQCN